MRRIIASLRTSPWSVVIVLLQLAIIALLVLGVGQPDEMYASNMPEDSGYAAREAASEAREANEKLRRMAINGVPCQSGSLGY